MARFKNGLRVSRKFRLPLPVRHLKQERRGECLRATSTAQCSSLGRHQEPGFGARACGFQHPILPPAAWEVGTASFIPVHIYFAHLNGNNIYFVGTLKGISEIINRTTLLAINASICPD